MIYYVFPVIVDDLPDGQTDLCRDPGKYERWKMTVPVVSFLYFECG